MASDVNSWIGRCKKWSDCGNLTWSEKILVESTFAAIDSGATSGKNQITVPQSHVKREIAKLTKEQEKKLITVLVKLHGKNYKQTKEVKEGIEITVEDIQFIIKEVKGIDVKVLKD